MIPETILKKSILWFLFLPVFVIGTCSFFLPLRYDSLYKTLAVQHEIENKIKLLSSEIRFVLDQPQTKEVQTKLEDLCAQLENTKKDLLEYKNDWGYSAKDALKIYFKKGMSTAADAYQPFIALMVIGIFFLAVAITRYRDVPFYMRAGSISTGSIINLIVISQWAFAALYAAMWYSKMTGVLVVLVLTIGTIGSCIMFIKNIYILEIKTNKKL